MGYEYEKIIKASFAIDEMGIIEEVISDVQRKEQLYNY